MSFQGHDHVTADTASSSSSSNSTDDVKTVLVLGASYGGGYAAKLLSDLLVKEENVGKRWRVVVVDRNTHANHVYVFPRFTLLPKHGAKAFIPYSGLLAQHPESSSAEDGDAAAADASSSSSSSSPSSPLPPAHQNLFIRGQVISLSKNSARVRRIGDSPKSDDSSDEVIQVPYDYLIYALGSTLPEPVDPWHAHAQLTARPDTTSDHDVQAASGKRSGGSRPSSPESERSATRSSKHRDGSIDLSHFEVDLPSIDPRPPSPALPPTPTSATSSFLAGSHNSRQQPASAVASSQFTPGVSPWLPPTPPCHTPELKARDKQQLFALLKGKHTPSTLDLRAQLTHHKHAQGAGTLEYGLDWMKERSEMIAKAKRIVVLGGGALGIQFATDIKELYPEKEVTLLHSRDRLLPLYPEQMHEAIADRCRNLGINLILGERAQDMDMRLIYDEQLGEERPEVVVTTSKGTVVEADMVLPCTGQRPNTAIMSAFLPHSVSPANNRLRMRRTLQLARPPRSIRRHEKAATSTSGELIEDRIFAIGDCADAFGAIQSGNSAYWQAEVAAKNVLRLIKRREGGEAEELQEYNPNPPMIKITLGMTDYVKCMAGEVQRGSDGNEDLDARLMWPYFGAAGQLSTLNENE